MRILVGCEFTQIVCKAFRDKGHDAFSCDILPTDGKPDWHIQDDVLNHLDDRWDMAIFFPPCTHLCSSGARWWPNKKKEQADAIEFFKKLMAAPIPKIAIENPVGIISTAIRKPDQIIQPWQFGHGEVKTTCLWLKNLPKLTPTDIISGRDQRLWKLSPSKTRSMERSKTYHGIAAAMAEQWGQA